MEEVTVEHEGKVYSASYILVDDELTVFLPDGTERSTALRGLKPAHAVQTHLRGYIHSLKSTKEQ